MPPPGYTHEQQRPANPQQQPTGWQQRPPNPPYQQQPPRGRHARHGQPPPPQPQQPAPGPYTHEYQRPAYMQQPQFQPPPPYPPQQYPYPHQPDGRDGTGATGRPGGGAADGPDGPDEPAEPRRSRLGSRTRRVIEACALAVLLPVLLGLHWIDESGRAESLDAPVRVSSVAKGKIGELLGARWTVYKREIVPGTVENPDAVDLQVVLAVKAQDAKSVQAIGGYGTTYRFVDGQGREWGANARTPVNVQPGKAFALTVRGTVPRAKAGSLALEVRAPETARKGAAPLPSLRFEP
ncbi:hypothetical protein [Actinomadura algeriensis]|uniref:DUF4352 domain-containing protein n=1 Tax=Actinomadura algeriensis TaxID=1679523 RepID=A0ABR9JSH1_9ACTN|nr:hypothetical protein [Actinomadura algeriensis]MBE1533328.1 hypothetical protein [Actinomadura algeriensis]